MAILVTITSAVLGQGLTLVHFQFNLSRF